MSAILGAWSKMDSRRGSTVPTAIDRLEKILWGNPPTRRFGAQRLYYSWGDRSSFPDVKMDDAITKGRIPVMSIGPPNDKYVNITNGNHDSQIAEWADGIAGLSTSGYLCFKHEANLYPALVRYGTSASTAPAEYVAAFRHIITIMRNHGVSGWRYGIILTHDGYLSSNAGKFYLGSSYTGSDGFLGVDGYNWNPCKPGSNWRNFTDTFSPFMSFAPAKKIADGCHLLIGEVGCQEGDAYDEVSGSY